MAGGFNLLNAFSTVIGPRGGRKPLEQSSIKVDVVTLNWQTQDILLGECKWGADRIDRQVVRDLLDEKTPILLQDLPEGGKGWKVHYALFSRSGFKPAVKTEMQQRGGLLVDLKSLDGVLGRA